jgi:hypothetical protein
LEFEFKLFESEEEMIEYTASPYYENIDSMPGLCAGISFIVKLLIINKIYCIDIR